jgi:hypothetical protein
VFGHGHGHALRLVRVVTARVGGPPDAVSLLPDAVSLLPGAVSLLPDAVSLLPDAVSLLPDAVSLLPDAVSLLPTAVSLLLGTVSLLPDAISLLPDAVSLLSATLSLPTDAISFLPEAVAVPPGALRVSAAADQVGDPPPPAGGAPFGPFFFGVLADGRRNSARIFALSLKTSFAVLRACVVVFSSWRTSVFVVAVAPFCTPLLVLRSPAIAMSARRFPMRLVICFCEIPASFPFGPNSALSKEF